MHGDVAMAAEYPHGGVVHYAVFPLKRGRWVLRPPIILDSKTFNFNVVH